MAGNNSYLLPEYKEKQSRIAKVAWQRRRITFTYKRERRTCARSECGITFIVEPHNPKRFCTRRCAAKVNNRLRGKLGEETRKKISQSLSGRPNPYKGYIRVPRATVTCNNPRCAKEFFVERWLQTKRRVRFCSNTCAMRVIGGQPTSPRASKGKCGVRRDVSPTIYFYSRWEANMARLYSHLGISWQYAPTTFDIGNQKYTPDFYLPKTNTYIEIKNFWWEYSRIRDNKFRKRYPQIRLEVILKEEYHRLEKRYAHLIPRWEYKNSKFDAQGSSIR